MTVQPQDGLCECEQSTMFPHFPEFHDPPPPVKVEMHHSTVMPAYLVAADYGTYTTWTFNTGNEPPMQILGRDEHRLRAVLQTDASTVWVGKREQIFASPLQGWKQTSTMQPLEIRNKQGLWVVATGTPCNVMVLSERWEE